jgi:hypothetical protein
VTSCDNTGYQPYPAPAAMDAYAKLFQTGNNDDGILGPARHIIHPAPPSEADSSITSRTSTSRMIRLSAGAAIANAEQEAKQALAELARHQALAAAASAEAAIAKSAVIRRQALLHLDNLEGRSDASERSRAFRKGPSYSRGHLVVFDPVSRITADIPKPQTSEPFSDKCPELSEPNFDRQLVPWEPNFDRQPILLSLEAPLSSRIEGSQSNLGLEIEEMFSLEWLQDMDGLRGPKRDQGSK